MNDLNDKCPWPHFVDTPICVYDRDSYDKYQTGEYQLPKRCICGATLVYDKPVTLCLVEHGKTVGEMLLELEYPLTFIRTDVLEEQREPPLVRPHLVQGRGVGGQELGAGEGGGDADIQLHPASSGGGLPTCGKGARQ